MDAAADLTIHTDNTVKVPNGTEDRTSLQSYFHILTVTPNLPFVMQGVDLAFFVMPFQWFYSASSMKDAARRRIRSAFPKTQI